MCLREQKPQNGSIMDPQVTTCKKATKEICITDFVIEKETIL